ncbi:hypothetical protein GLOTRDRAFT_95651 [Gloeophyllum trabeum ATCC 11539]|uniref:Uncharacterized protein n=1 Tax=Gloeophyllum trabeum (strain ATCC 11539 / FP-39264 / Madison 617) TaxID=670483 RepID=S7PZW3_GLOTA|nr:uncharacterized protein GLOTRDRAFT_95651 [Gloeophyllum trabeum ATCC 11539]EPQ52827.1 hypothetical protein GLOTRDRAFT_95651 [Gloeophyllum trabeum ATCC 11539]
MSDTYAPVQDSETARGLHARPEDKLKCGILRKPEDGQGRTEDETVIPCSSPDAYTASAVKDISSSSELKIYLTDDATDATSVTQDSSEVGEDHDVPCNQPATLSLRDRISDAHRILTGAVPLRQVSYYRAVRAIEDTILFNRRWERYHRAVEAAGGWVPEWWIIVGDRPRLVEVIVDRWREEGDWEGQEKTIHWDWYCGESPPSYEELWSIGKKAAAIWNKIRETYKPPITATEYAARLSETTSRPLNAEEAPSIEISITGPPEDELNPGFRSGRTIGQDPAFLTTTLLRDTTRLPRVQSEERRKRHGTCGQRGMSHPGSQGDTMMNLKTRPLERQ